MNKLQKRMIELLPLIGSNVKADIMSDSLPTLIGLKISQYYGYYKISVKLLYSENGNVRTGWFIDCINT